MPQIADRRPVHSSVEELLADAEERRPLVINAKSGARLEKVTIGGAPYVVKYLDQGDWSLRAAGVPAGAVVELWRRGILHALPGCFNQPIMAVARTDMSVLLMHDVSKWLVPDTDSVLPLESTSASSTTWRRCMQLAGTARLVRRPQGGAETDDQAFLLARAE